MTTFHIFNICLGILFVILYNLPYFRTKRKQQAETEQVNREIKSAKYAAELEAAELTKFIQLYDRMKAHEEPAK